MLAENRERTKRAKKKKYLTVVVLISPTPAANAV
jgi:hypothetical protein